MCLIDKDISGKYHRQIKNMLKEDFALPFSVQEKKVPFCVPQFNHRTLVWKQILFEKAVRLPHLYSEGEQTRASGILHISWRLC